MLCSTRCPVVQCNIESGSVSLNPAFRLLALFLLGSSRNTCHGDNGQTSLIFQYGRTILQLRWFARYRHDGSRAIGPAASASCICAPDPRSRQGRARAARGSPRAPAIITSHHAYHSCLKDGRDHPTESTLESRRARAPTRPPSSPRTRRTGCGHHMSGVRCDSRPTGGCLCHCESL